MQNLIKLLRDRNHFLEKFCNLNECELTRFTNGNFDNLENFYQTREKILDLIRFTDAKVEKAMGTMTESNPISKSDKHIVRAIMMVKDQLAEKILKLDLEILAIIDATKKNIIKELQEVRQAKKAVGGYKSKTFNQRLDEEA